jgi:electron transport complex protein RnfB
MATDIYQKLAHHLDDLPGGFPATESGVELRILRRLFTPEDAELALHLSLIPEEARVIARRANLTSEEASRRLRAMESKGLVNETHDEDKPPQYMAAQFIIGIWEYQVNNLTPELVRDFEEYLPHFVDFDTWKKAPQLRTIPVGESFGAQGNVMPYERAEELVRAQEKFAVAPCICRRERRMMDEGCDKPLESCLVFGMGAEQYQRNGQGRLISRGQALEILHRAEEAGLVLQPDNAKEAQFICCCCGCCCGVLRSLKRHPKPASLVSTPFTATANPDTCVGCGTCIDRCQMEALHLDDGKVVLDLDRCIGCGLCVTTCPTDSLALVRKPESEQPFVPDDIVKANIRMGQARGKLGAGKLVGMLVKSKLDRLLAPR